MEPMVLGILGGMAAIFGGIIFVLSRDAPSRDAKQSDYSNVYPQPAQSYGGSKRRGSKMNKSRKRR